MTEVTEKEQNLAAAVKKEFAEVKAAKGSHSVSKDFSIPGNGRTLHWSKDGQKFSASIIRIHDEGRFLVQIGGERKTIRTEKQAKWKGVDPTVVDSFTIS